jgi:hypothetical protein
LDLTTGELKTEIGGGATPDSNNNLHPLDTLISSNALFGMAIHNEQFLYSTNSAGNCRIRNYNRSLGLMNFLNVLIDSLKISTVGNSGTCGGTFGEGDSALTISIDGPNSIALSPNGDLYGSLRNRHCIFKINSSGQISTVAGLCGTSGNNNGLDLSSARFNQPTNIAIDPIYPTNLFMMDSVNNSLRYINLGPDYVFITFSGVPTNTVNIVATEPTAGGQMAGVAAFANQVCYSAGTNLARVVCVDRASGIQTLRVGSLFSIPGAPLASEQENIPAQSAFLGDPEGLNFDAAGNLYIMDYKSHTIRKVKRWF